jgi:hypothetical protein
MKKLITASLIVALFQFIFAGFAKSQLTSFPDGGNKIASVSEQVGLTYVTIHYNRPHVNKREGHIWGELIPVGYVNQGFGSSKAAPWRAGANENTTIEFSTDVKVEGLPLPAGKYGFFVAYDPNECTLIFSKNSTSWGSFFYNASEDVLRVKVKPVSADKSVEWLKFEFADEMPGSTTIQLQWEKLIIPFKIDVDLVNTQIQSFRKELRSEKGFLWESWNQGALYCQQNNANLEEALLWADTATSVNFGGSQNFASWHTKSLVLESLGRNNEATETMKKAITFGNVVQLYRYARTLVNQKKAKEAFDIFLMNQQKYPDEFLANLGMARGYSALGDYKKALTFAMKALPEATSKSNKDVTDKAIKTLEEGKDIN